MHRNPIHDYVNETWNESKTVEKEITKRYLFKLVSYR